MPTEASSSAVWQNGDDEHDADTDYSTMMEHGVPTPDDSRGVAEFAREAGAGISAAFVLVAMMLPLGLIAFALPWRVCRRGGAARGAGGRAIFGNLTAVILNRCAAPQLRSRAPPPVFLFAAFILRIAGDAQLRASPTARRGRASLFLAALCRSR